MRKFPWWKWLSVWALFLVIHFSYKTFPNNFMLIFGEASEAIFTHMKMAFWAYFLVSVLEILIGRRKPGTLATLVYSRLFVAVAYPWLVITLWFTASALGFSLPEMPWEIIYANITTSIGIYIALRLEEVLDGVSFRPALKASIVLLFALSLLSYLSFTFNPPDPGYFFVGP